MSERSWEERLREVYDRASKVYDEDGGRTPEECFSVADREFLATLGCSPQEMYDFVEDGCWAGEPSFEEVLEVTRIRREYFLKVQGGVPSQRRRRPSDFPSAVQAAGGIPWLPRILEKARAKLRGELPPELMYGCGGDRPFLRSFEVGLAEFLERVRDADGNDAAIVEWMKSRDRG